MIAAAAMLGKPLMPWQARVVLVALEVQSEEAGDPDPGSWAYDRVGVSVQRQAGKTYLVRPVIAHRMRSNPGGRLWSTAQTGVHARRRWLDLSESLVRSPIGGELKRLTGAGHEVLTWRSTGATLEPFAPNGESLHGETPIYVLADELWAFDAEQWRQLRQAYRPGFTTTDGQVWMLSTAGDHSSAALNGVRKQGRAAVEAGSQLGLAWFEWQLPDEVDGVPVEDLDDRALVEACIRWHPANGRTLRPASVRAAWAEFVEEDYALGRAEFLRAYGNRTPGGGRPRFYPLTVWRRSRAAELELAPGRVALGFEVDPDGREASVTACNQLEDGRRIVEVVEHREGTSWLVPRLLELLEAHDVARISCNAAGATREAADLLELALDEEKRQLLDRVNASDYAAACVRVDRILRDEKPELLHRGQSALDAAAGDVTKRKIGGSWGYAPTPSSAVSALVSATMASWAWDHAPAPEPESGFWIG